ncbi:hypothetical protein ARAM_006515 [Aspergillus rambellii]|uniref:NADH:flavin oxidoreductase/NADH oxidase N-terminal domain-containing protein n=1 Tax=Aspergillus rambellii TaxID=308745 RepID=A0A0F8TXI0_9EURO|nr:hypothetical protein ARAM_006515 [Aspergillus rambellii]
MSRLFEPITIGNANLNHRVVMAPLTRFRTDDNNTPLPMVGEYYEQRASTPGTLLISEAIQVSPAAGGMPYGPGIWSAAQIAAWKKVTDAVHAKGSYMFCQLIALGRAADPECLRETGNYDFCAPSPLPMEAAGPDSAIPRELREEEIQSIIGDFATAAKNAIAAGFDGVEAHGANGYLIDQFLEDVTNQRTDRWGGSVENRARFALGVAKAMVDAVGAERVAFRLSPWNTWQGMKMKDPVPQFSYVVEKLREMNLAYLHLTESRVVNSEDVAKTEGIEFLLDIWGPEAPVIVAGGYNAENTSQAVDIEYKKYNVAVAYGRHFIANPDLPFRLQKQLSLNKYQRATFYTPKVATGYVDYPFSPEFLAAKA